MSAPTPSERVLPTLNLDGSRNWIRPKPAHGSWLNRRRITAYALMVVFFGIPQVTIRGMPAVLLDLPRRQFTILGTTFLPTDTLLLMLLLGSFLVSIFLFSALFGRVWCGWACPQTIYMEFIFRPLERLLEGGRSGSLAIDREKGKWHPRRWFKNFVYLVIASFLAHTFLAYFVGVRELEHWVRMSPAQHPTPFLVMAFTTTIIFLDFAWFREQTCLIACPYGRWQAALLDRQSTIVAYDYNRGEPRRHGVKDRPATAGDCIDCGACVITCPTGIDIRNGLQMECIHCTQCMDACDTIMTQVGKPKGLIRYASRDTLAGLPRKLLRPRVVLYPMAFVIFFGGFLLALGTKSAADITVLRSGSVPFTVEADGSVANQVRVKIANRSRKDHLYTITVIGADGGRVIAPENPLPVEAGTQQTTSVFIVLPRTAFQGGQHNVTIRITDTDDFKGDFPFNLLGPSAQGGTTP
jgi:cytochrome c oxidase accessory protein FixG